VHAIRGHKVEDRSGKIGPARLFATSKMKEAAKPVIVRLIQEILCDGDDGHGDIRCIGWATVLIGNNADFVSTLGQGQHCADEVFTKGRIDPGGTQDNVIRRRSGYSLFTRQF
jgi:hypothetical protein